MTPFASTTARMASRAMPHLRAMRLADDLTRPRDRVARPMTPPVNGFLGASAPRRHFCFVTETYLPEINGAAMTLSRLCEGLRARDHIVSIVRPRRPGVDRHGPSPDASVSLVPGAPVPGYRGVRAGWPAWRLLRACWTARRPDAVYVATPGPLGWAAVHTARHLGLPVLSGFHTNFPRYARHYGAAWLGRAVFGYLRRLHNRTEGTVVPSADLLAQLHAAGFENLTLLGRGVDSRVFDPAHRRTALRARWGVSADAFVALYVGRVAPEKNIELAIEAYRTMRRVGRVERLVIVGDGPLRGALQAAHPDVLFCGVQTGLPLAEHYASADVFLFSSETETFGNVVLEAMASGLAVVAYDYAAARAHLRTGHTGALVPYGNSAAFIAAAEALARDPESVAGVRSNARAHAVLCDWETVVNRFEALLAGIVAWLPPLGPGEEGAVTRRSHAGLSTRRVMTRSGIGGTGC
jgi:glycosyltransferase involved in cell wall biosynthesis